MAEFNACASLVNEQDYAKAEREYDALVESGVDPLQAMLDMQMNLQKDLSSRLPERNADPSNLNTCGEILDWLRKNHDAIDDERRELYTSLGGMSNGEKKASAVWKDWKADNVQARNLPFTDLTPEDQLEVLFEKIDILHFELNTMIALGLKSKDVFMLYYLKNAENFRRYESGY